MAAPNNAGVSAQQLAQMQQSGYSGSYYDSNGQLQQMKNGATAAPAAAAATGAGTTPAPAAAPTGLGNGQGDLGNYNNWMTSGGVNSPGWQNFGGDRNTDYLNMSNWTQGGADPTQVQTNGDAYSTAQPFINASYSQATQMLDPQVAAQNSAFDQQMVNQGIAPGSAAYDTAKSQMTQGQNQQYQSAQNAALQQGLTAQAQMFGQGLSQSQLANSLSQSLIGANSANNSGQLSGNASLMQALLSGNSNIAQQQIGGNAQMNSAASSAGASRYGSQLNAQTMGNAQDDQMLQWLLGQGQGVTSYNNGLLNSDQDRNQSLYQNQLPGGQQGNIDVENPYNQQYNGEMAQNQYGNNQANAQNSQYAQYAAMLASLFGG